MGKLKAGFIGFVPFGAKGDEFYDIIKSYAEIGYKGFEHGMNLLNGDLDANLARVKGYGIEPICGPMVGGFPGMPEPDLGQIAEQCHKMGVKRLAMYSSATATFTWGMRPTPVSYDEQMKQIEEFETKASFFKKEGIDFMFHNHDAELTTRFSGIPLLDLMFMNTDDLTFELDVGWVSYGGGDPVDYIHRFGNRISALHIKDYDDSGWVVPEPNKGSKFKNTKPIFTTPGTGAVDINGCLKAGAELGIEWAIVEQDFQRNLTQKETLTAAYLNMKESGYVE